MALLGVEVRENLESIKKNEYIPQLLKSTFLVFFFTLLAGFFTINWYIHLVYIIVTRLKTPDTYVFRVGLNIVSLLFVMASLSNLFYFRYTLWF